MVTVTSKALPSLEAKSRLVIGLSQHGYTLVRDTDLTLEFSDNDPVPAILGMFLTCNSCPPPIYRLKVVIASTSTATVVQARPIIVANPGTGLQREVGTHYRPESANRIRSQIESALK
jgi:hypothetical protein